MATWNSNGHDVGGSGGYVSGTQSVSYILANFANTGDTITIPVGTFSWGVMITGTLTFNSNVITGLSSTSGLVVGEKVATSTGLGGGVTITSIDSSSQIHISALFGAGTQSLPIAFGGVTISKSITLEGLGISSFASNGAGDSTSIIQNPTTLGITFQMTSGSDGHITCKGIYFKQTADNSGGAGFFLGTDRDDSTAYTVLVTQCSFSNNSFFTYLWQCQANGVIIWNNNFYGTGGPPGVISFVMTKYGFTSVNIGPSGSAVGWNTPSTMGTLDTTGLNNCYVETNYFQSYGLSCVNADDNARLVFRDNYCQDAITHAHSQDTSEFGYRHMEVYNNTYRNVNASSLNLNCWIYIRGAVFLCTGNTMDVISSKESIVMICQQISRGSSLGGCQVGYPANRQVASAWSSGSSATYGNAVVTQDGTGYIHDPCYIWNNTGTGGQTYANYVGVDEYNFDAGNDPCGHGLLSSIKVTATFASGSPIVTAIGTVSTINNPGTPPQSPVNVNATTLMTTGMGVYAPGFLPAYPSALAIQSINSSSQITLTGNATNSGTATLATGFITQDTDFVVGTARPGWTPYTYPHPLTQSGNITPSLTGTISLSGSVNPAFSPVRETLTGQMQIAGSVNPTYVGSSAGGFGGPTKLIVERVT